MPRIINIQRTWQTVGPLANAETWQCVEGKVAISLAASPGDNDGIVLFDCRGWDIAAGKTREVSPGW